MRTINILRPIRKILPLILIMLVSASCENWLELIPPNGLVKDEYWQSKEDVQATLMGAYQKFASLDNKLFMLGEIRADMLTKDVNTPAYVQNIMNGNIYPDNGLCNWLDFYTVINYCNYVIKYAPIVLDLDPTFTEYQMKGFTAEAIFLRSLAYFYLVRTFRNVPLVLEASESDGVDFYLPATDEETILDQIKSDLQDARLFVTEEYKSDEENKGRATKPAIDALLADICLWSFEYDECIEYIQEVEDLGFDMVPGGQWFGIFYPGNSFEGIFEFQFDESLGQSNSIYNQTYYKNIFLASEKATDLLDPSISEEIIRGDGSIRYSDLKIWKYCGAAADGRTLRPSAESNSCNWIVYRMSDLLLMKAEALSQLGRYEEALQIVNQVRNKRLVNSVTVSYTAEAFEDMILEERARELAFEGKRWFDLLRMGRRNDYLRKSNLIEIIIEKVPSTQKLVLASKLTNPWGWYLPIYKDELERNANLTQNSYYAEYDKD